MNLKYFQRNGFVTPILVKEKTGLGLRFEHFSSKLWNRLWYNITGRLVVQFVYIFVLMWKDISWQTITRVQEQKANAR